MYDAILILGGGVRDGAALPPWAAARFDLALELEQGEPFVCLSAGTTHRPPPLEHGFPVAESVAGARYLLGRGVPARRIRIENVSYDTVGNAYFAKVLHVDPAGWRRLLVITSEFHMPRSEAIFRHVFDLEPGKYELAFAASPNTGMAEAVARSRERKEAASLQRFLDQTRHIATLPQLHEWLFTEHQAYSAAGQWMHERSREPAVLDSY